MGEREGVESISRLGVAATRGGVTAGDARRGAVAAAAAPASGYYYGREGRVRREVTVCYLKTPSFGLKEGMGQTFGPKFLSPVNWLSGINRPYSR